MSATILFDGECHLCNASIDFVMRNDPQRYFRFGSLQSEEARVVLTSFGRDPSNFASVVLIENSTISTESTAALRIATKLRKPYCFLGVLQVLPQAFRDHVYLFIARNRYKWFGRRKTCRVPTAVERERFL